MIDLRYFFSFFSFYLYCVVSFQKHSRHESFGVFYLELSMYFRVRFSFFIFAYSPGYHPSSALGFALPAGTAVREHAHKSPLVPALARASTPPVRPLLLQSAQVKGCLGVAGVLQARGPT